MLIKQIQTSIPTMVLMFAGILLTARAYSQSVTDLSAFHGATADLKAYKALYILNSSDEKKRKGARRNISNALEDPRLKGRLEIELVAFTDRLAVFKKSS